jgi:DNA polymerase-3 subunit delta
MKREPTVHPERHDVSTLYLLYGDEFLVKEQVRQLVDQVLPKDLQKTNLVVVDGHNLDAGYLVSLVATPSLFGEERVILVDQTTLFMGRSDQGRLAAKVIQSWKTGERRAAMRSLSQLLSLAGLGSDDIRSGAQWAEEVLGASSTGGDKEALAAAGQSFLEEGGAIRSGDGEDLIEELVLSEPPIGTVLIFTAAAVDKRKKLFKAVSQRGRVVECAAHEQKYGGGLDRSFFDNRVKDALKQAGKRITPKVLERMYSRSGRELRRLHGELDKLVAFLGDRVEVTGEDVDNVFTDFHEASFFDLTNALRSADISKCLPALHEHLKIAAHPLQTLAVIAADFRKLMVARELLFTVFRSHWKPGMSYDQFKRIAELVRKECPEAARKSKLNLLSMPDYPLFLLLRDVQKFPMEKLIRIMEACLEADIRLKSSRLGHRAPATILEGLVMTVCAPVERSRRS